MKLQLRGAKGSASLYFNKLRKLHQVLGSEGCLSPEVFVSVAEQLLCAQAPVGEELRGMVRLRASESTPQFSDFCVFVTSVLRDCARRLMGDAARVVDRPQLVAVAQVTHVRPRLSLRQDFGLAADQAGRAVDSELAKPKYRDGQVRENQFCDFVAEVCFLPLDVDSLVAGLQRLMVRSSGTASPLQPLSNRLSLAGSALLQHHSQQMQMQMRLQLVRAVARWSTRVRQAGPAQPASPDWLSSPNPAALSIGLNPLKSAMLGSPAPAAAVPLAESRSRLLSLMEGWQRQMAELQGQVRATEPLVVELELTAAISQLQQEAEQAAQAHSRLEASLAQREREHGVELSRLRRSREQAEAEAGQLRREKQELERRCKELERGHMALVCEVERLDRKEDERDCKLAGLESELLAKTVRARRVWGGDCAVQRECDQLVVACQELEVSNGVGLGSYLSPVRLHLQGTQGLNTVEQSKRARMKLDKLMQADWDPRMASCA